jgi:dihydroorotate dehydrogenase electron transfer subunit
MKETSEKHLKKAHMCRLVSAEEIAGGIFDFTVEAPEIAAEAKCGQFLHIKCGDGVFLRRPISICDTSDTEVRFIFEVKGRGTELLAEKKAGDMLDIMGPLGHGFEIKPEYKKAVIIGGGIGVFPLFKLAKNIDADIFLGFRSKDRIVMEKEFEAVSKTLTIGTDDGSCGYRGYIAGAAEEFIDKNGADIIFACGPTPMLRAVKTLAESRGIPCQVSMEQRMGCGIGACLVCTCETNKPGMDGQVRVCKDGPVFFSTEVTLNG